MKALKPFAQQKSLPKSLEQACLAFFFFQPA
jgi:hypothetical protein